MKLVKKLGGMILFCMSTLQAADYYVAPAGDDADNGAIGTPFKTIAKASSVMTAGDNCYLRTGTYRETITPVNSGTAGNEITYQAYQDEEVKLLLPRK